jgi:AhpD family alkylhydroperoxidase
MKGRPMKTTLSLTLVLTAALASAALADRKAQPTPQPASPAAATLAQIESTFGFVPGFIKAIPPALLPAWWQASMVLDGPDTKLDGKTKQLISLAVAAQVPCDYCIQYHTEAARLYGASEQELQEAVAMAASVRQNSTIMNGMQVDRVQFRKDVERFVKVARQSRK